MNPEPDPEIDILVSVEEPRWEEVTAEAEALCLRAARAALSAALADDPALLPPGPAELSLVLADDATVQSLNLTYRGKDKPTNVLSFALHADGVDAQDSWEGDYPDQEEAGDADEQPDEDEDFLSPGPAVPVLLGDVILAYETVAREADEQSKPFADHMTHLVAHGVLHLLGYDHIEDSEAEQMERLETKILSGLGIADPYAGRDPAGGYRAPDDPGDAGTIPETRR